jgi:hypothetical protein
VELAGVVIPESEVTLSQRIDAGQYGWVNDDITEKRFPIMLPAGPRDLAIVCFHEEMSSKQVEEWATENAYELAKLEDLLAVGSHSEHKELQRRFPIVALGYVAVIHEYRRVPYLYSSGTERDLHLYWCDNDWYAKYRFLLRKKPSDT